MASQDEGPGVEAARQLESMGLLGLLRRPLSVSREEYSCLLFAPLVLVVLMCSLGLALVGLERGIMLHSTSTTTTPNPAIESLHRIQHPDFRGLGEVFLGVLLACPLGGLLGLATWLLDRQISRWKCCQKKRKEEAWVSEQSMVSPASIQREDSSSFWPSLHSPSNPLGLQESLVPALGGENGEMVEFPDISVASQFMRRAGVKPAHLAATFGEQRVSAGELRKACLDAAVLLREAGIAENCLVALYLPAGMSSIVAIFGTWLACGAWIPIDREAPPPRVKLLLEEGQPRVVVCDEEELFLEVGLTLLRPCADGLFLQRGSVASTAWTASERENWLRECGLAVDAWSGPAQDSVAQVIYTSGSTGLPKGVVYSQRRLTFACYFFAQQNNIREGTKVLQKTPYIWAVFRHEVFPALCHGGSLVVAEQHERKDPMKLAKLLLEQDVEVIVATPSVLDLVIGATGGSCPKLKVAVCMGEGLQKEVAQRILERAGRGLTLHNFYGSTETENTHFTVPPLGDGRWRKLTQRYLPAGRPQPRVSLHVLDPHSLEIRPPNVAGEICFGGVLSDGYWQRPNLTTEKFVEHPELGRIYRTGDVGIWNPRLGLQVVGRTDRQVKIRGIRIELEEVEARLKEAVLAAGGKEAAAVAAPAPGAAEVGDERTVGIDDADVNLASDHLTIVAFAAGQMGNGGVPDSSLIRKECISRMPPYMVPSIIQTMEELPRLPNQKVDLKALAKLAEKAEETVQALDSLGMLRLLSRAQVEEDVWIQNQQAFWMLVVMLGHFQLNTGASDSDGVDCGNWAWRVEMLLGHGKDMVAFILMVGLTDSRDPIAFGPRDWVLVFMALMMTGPISYILSPGYGPLKVLFWPPGGIGIVGHGWFLYSFVFARLCLQAFHRLRIRPVVQILTMFIVSALFPDDVFDLVPDDVRSNLWTYDAAFRYKGFRWSFLFMTACYLMGFYAGPPTVRLARRLAPRTGASVAALVGAGWTAFLTMSALNAPDAVSPWGYPTFQAVYDENTSSHLIKWHYMTHPSIWVYLALWLGEALLFILPGLFVGIAMAYCPVHFKTMGTTSLGNYVLHPTYIGAPWLAYVQTPVLSRITSPSYGVVANIVIVFTWNVVFCLVFAHTFSAWFHWGLVNFFQLIKRCCMCCMKSRRAHP